MDGRVKNNIKKIEDISDIKTETLKAIEELSELIRVLSRIVDADYKTFNENKANLIEEIADVEIMLQIVEDFYKINSADILAMMVYKTERTLERLEENDKI